MDEKLKATINKIKILSEQNSEFAQEMRKMFGNTSSASVVSIPQKLSDDVTAIREALEIRANNSISYAFVSEERLRKQLNSDNLRMENAALDIKERDESHRFYIFCVNAFYQLENVVNYYFHVTYPQINDLVSVIEKYTDQEKEDFRYVKKKTGEERNVSDIQVAYKINALCNMFFSNNSKLKWDLIRLRKVRNEGEHRCMIILQEKNETDFLYQFFKENTFNDVRVLLLKVVAAIKKNIGKPMVSKIESVEASISVMLPSMCTIEYSGNKELIPDNLFRKVRGMQVGDKIQVYISEGKIIDVV